jgi:hypothetical protein
MIEQFYGKLLEKYEIVLEKPEGDAKEGTR